MKCKWQPLRNKTSKEPFGHKICHHQRLATTSLDYSFYREQFWKHKPGASSYWRQAAGNNSTFTFQLLVSLTLVDTLSFPDTLEATSITSRKKRVTFNYCLHNTKVHWIAMRLKEICREETFLNIFVPDIILWTEGTQLNSRARTICLRKSEFLRTN